MGQNQEETGTSLPTVHWADHVAEEVIQKHPNKAELVCAAGISPSGVVHIGNFREGITVDLVVRALRNKGKKVKFIWSWDDYDALRKTPKNLPDPEAFKEHLRKPIANIPDPFGQESSYAAHFEKRFEAEVARCGIFPEFRYQSQQYKSGIYKDGISKALQSQSHIVPILNEHRTQPLPEDWSCVTIYCETCDRDICKILKFSPPYELEYECKACKEKRTFDFSKKPGAKLLWRVDWPMRWHHEGVDFEPGGKDHSSQGGSFQTGSQIIEKVWQSSPPHGLQYDFVLIKGIGSKLSSSSGNLVTVGEALEVYEPAIVRWLFASRKPNLDFSIAFDLDVMKAYDDFDRTERIALGMEEAEDKKVNYFRRIYELSVVKKEDLEIKNPAQFPFRHLCNILQIYQGDRDRTATFYKEAIQSPSDKNRFEGRAKCAWKWITTYAPEAFRFALQENPTEKTQYADAVKGMVNLLEGECPNNEDELAQAVYEIIKANEIKPKLFFQEIYRLLIGKTSGPKLASFLLAVGPTKAAQILQRTL